MRDMLFFHASRQIFARVTEIFNFVWPTAVAIWNLRWQVAGYLMARPEASDSELTGRFALGSDIRANIRPACVETSWATQQETFAKFLLLEFCSLYEEWTASVLEELGVKSKLSKKKFGPYPYTCLQFPQKTSIPGSKNEGAQVLISELTTPKSGAMSDCIYPTLLKHRKNSRLHLNELLVCFRFFKECRNDIIHNGSVAQKKTEAAYLAFSALSKASLGVSEIPRHHPVVHAHPVRLELRGVVGFAEVILRLMATIDAELSCSAAAEQLLIAKWKKQFGTINNVASNPPKRHQDIVSYLKKLGLPAPVKLAKIEQFLKTNALIL